MASSTFLLKNEDSPLTNAKYILRECTRQVPELGVEKKRVPGPFEHLFGPPPEKKPLSNRDAWYESNRKKNKVTVDRPQGLDEKQFELANYLIEEAYQQYRAVLEKHELENNLYVACNNGGSYGISFDVSYQGHPASKAAQVLIDSPARLPQPMTHISFAEMEEKLDVLSSPLHSLEWQSSAASTHVTHVFSTKEKQMDFFHNLLAIQRCCDCGESNFSLEVKINEEMPFRVTVLKDALEKAKKMLLDGKKFEAVTKLASGSSSLGLLGKAPTVPLIEEIKTPAPVECPPGGLAFK